MKSNKKQMERVMMIVDTRMLALDARDSVEEIADRYFIEYWEEGLYNLVDGDGMPMDILFGADEVDSALMLSLTATCEGHNEEMRAAGLQLRYEKRWYN